MDHNPNPDQPAIKGFDPAEIIATAGVPNSNFQELPAAPAAPVIPAADPAAAAADAAPADPAKPAEAPAAPAKPPTEQDLIDQLINGVTAEDAPELDEATQSVFEKHLGTKDVKAHLTEYNTLKEQVTQLQDKAKAYDDVFKRISEMPYELSKAVEAASKGEDYKPLLEKLNRGITLSKEAKDIDQFALVDEHFPGKFNEEEKESIKAGDPHLKGAFEKYWNLAADQHNASRENEKNRIVSSQKQRQEYEQAAQKADAAAIAEFKQDKILSQLAGTDIVEKFQNGSLEQELYNPDGTKTAKFLVILAKAQNYDKVVARVRESATAAGRVDGELAARARMPDGPAGGYGGSRGAPPAPKDPKQEQHSAIMELIAGASVR